MKNYLIGIGLVLIFLSIKHAHSMQDALSLEQIKQFQQLLKACADNPQLAGQMLGQIETVRLDDEDSLDGVSIIDKARHLTEVEQQLTLHKEDIMTDSINDPRYKKHKVFSLELHDIDPGTPFISQFESLINWRERLYNLRTLSLSHFDGVREFVQRFFSRTGAGYARADSPYFVSLIQINLVSREGLSAIDGTGLRLILDHFSEYTDVVRDMEVYNARNGHPVAVLRINGVSDTLISQTDLSGYSVHKRSIRLKTNVHTHYRSGQPTTENELIVMLER